MLKICRKSGRAMTSEISQLKNIPLRFNDEESFLRVGLIVLATDLTSEHDFMKLCAHPQIRLHVSRTAYQNPVTPENLTAMERGLASSASLLAPGVGLAAVYFSCTSAGAILGDKLVADRIQSVKGAVPVITPLSAASMALKSLQIKRLSVLTPYTGDVARPVGDYFSRDGFTVCNVSCMGLEDDRDMARLESESIVAAAEKTISDDADALFISCTALRSARIATLIEEKIGRPVVTSNQAAAWHVLKIIKIKPDLPDYGRLMSSLRL